MLMNKFGLLLSLVQSAAQHHLGDNSDESCPFLKVGWGSSYYIDILELPQIKWRPWKYASPPFLLEAAVEKLVDRKQINK